jgi:ATP-binding cassette subfamily B protein
MSRTAEPDDAPRRYDRQLAGRLFAYVRPWRALVAGAVTLIIVQAGLQLVGPLLTRWVIDDALPARDVRGVSIAALLFAAAMGAQFAVTYGETVLTALLGQRVMRDLRHELFTHLQMLPVRVFDRTPVGRMVTRTTSDVEALNELFTSGVVAALGDIVTLVAIGVVMLVIDWQLALTAFLVIPFVFLASRVFQSRVRLAAPALSQPLLSRTTGIRHSREVVVVLAAYASRNRHAAPSGSVGTRYAVSFAISFRGIASLQYRAIAL